MSRSPLSAAFASEWRKLRLRPAVHIMTAITFFSVILFAYILPYVQFHNPHLAYSTTPTLTAAYFYPADFLHATIALAPTFSIIALIIGALTAGSEYSFGTLRVILTQGPSRATSLFGSFVALAYVMLLLALLTFVAGALSAVGFALYDDTSLSDWPSLATILAALGATWLLFVTFAALGVALAHLFRQAAAAIGLGLAYLILVEGILVHYLLGINHTVDDVLKLLPTVDSQSLVAAFSPTPLSGQALAQIVGLHQAVLLLFLYLALFVLYAAHLLVHRDIL